MPCKDKQIFSLEQQHVEKKESKANSKAEKFLTMK